MKCDTCEIRVQMEKSKEPACCVWYMDNVVCGNASVNDCPDYKKTRN